MNEPKAVYKVCDCQSCCDSFYPQMIQLGVQSFFPISDTEWEWVCSRHGRNCRHNCPREETSA